LIGRIDGIWNLLLFENLIVNVQMAALSPRQQPCLSFALLHVNARYGRFSFCNTDETVRFSPTSIIDGAEV
jgi:hypothetical protein